MSSVASLFDSCPTVVPQFKVITKRTLLSPSSITKEDKKSEKSRPKHQENGQTRRRRSRDPRDKKTVFVGNISLPCTRKLIKHLFKKYGTVESVRLRSMRVQPGELPAKIALRRQKQIVEGSCCNAYVVMSTQEEAENSLAANGVLFQGRHLRVDLLSGKSKSKSKDVQSKSVFVGNLPFTADEEKLREAFSPCGQVETVRIVRDKKTGIGKGFGFVSFSETSGVMFALQRTRTTELDGRKLRVFKSKTEEALKTNQFSGLKSSRQSVRSKVKGKMAALHGNPRSKVKGKTAALYGNPRLTKSKDLKGRGKKKHGEKAADGKRKDRRNKSK